MPSASWTTSTPSSAGCAAHRRGARRPCRRCAPGSRRCARPRPPSVGSCVPDFTDCEPRETIASERLAFWIAGVRRAVACELLSQHVMTSDLAQHTRIRRRPTTCVPRRCRELGVLLLLLSAPRMAGGSCNVIPASEPGLRSELGAVSRPFAGPGDEVVVVRDVLAFTLEPRENHVQVVFLPPGGVATSVDVGEDDLLPPAATSPCKPELCASAWCSCVRFRFPNTDALADAPSDGRTLTGPAMVLVTTNGETSARIGALRAPGADCRDSLFPHFLGLPPPNSFASLLGDGGTDVLAAIDDAGNLYVPFDFTAVRPRPKISGPGAFMPLVPLVEVHVPGLGLLGELEAASFTLEGRRLAATSERAASEELRGFADGAASVVRFSGGGDKVRVAGLMLPGQRGPVVVPGVSAEARRDKWMDGTTRYVGSDVLVYENPECTPVLDPGSSCEDLNGDGDVHDHFLRVLDLRTPRAEPAIIHQIDDSGLTRNPAYTDRTCPYIPLALSALGGTPGMPPYGLYQFRASDSLVEYSIPETSCFDLDGDSVGGAFIAGGAFDIRRGKPIDVPRDAHRELSGNVLAWIGPRDDGVPYLGALFVYDARRDDPGPRILRGSGGRELTVGGSYPFTLWQPWGFSQYGPGVNSPSALAVSDRYVALAVS